MALAGAAVASIAVPAVTWLTVDRPDTDVRTTTATAAQPTTSTTTTPAATTATTAAPPTTAVEAPAPPPPAVVPTASTRPTSCRRTNRGVLYTGTLTNTSSVASGFAVEGVLQSTKGTRVDSASAVVHSVQPGQTVRWEMRFSGSGTAASCETVRVRPV